MVWRLFLTRWCISLMATDLRIRAFSCSFFQVLSWMTTAKAMSSLSSWMRLMERLCLPTVVSMTE